MYVWRDKAGRIESVTGSIHRPTLDYLLAEDDRRREQSGDKKPATRPGRPAKQQQPKEPVKQEPQAPVNEEPKEPVAADPKGAKGSEN